MLQSCIFPVYILIRSIKSQYIAPSLALQKHIQRKNYLLYLHVSFVLKINWKHSNTPSFCLLKLTAQCYSVFGPQLWWLIRNNSAKPWLWYILSVSSILILALLVLCTGYFRILDRLWSGHSWPCGGFLICSRRYHV